VWSRPTPPRSVSVPMIALERWSPKPPLHTPIGRAFKWHGGCRHSYVPASGVPRGSCGWTISRTRNAATSYAGAANFLAKELLAVGVLLDIRLHLVILQRLRKLRQLPFVDDVDALLCRTSAEPRNGRLEHVNVIGAHP
jgi:hypothetical protein